MIHRLVDFLAAALDEMRRAAIVRWFVRSLFLLWAVLVIVTALLLGGCFLH